MAFNGIGSAKKTDNHPQARKAKIVLRQNVLAAIGPKARVFDAFAGSGEMYSAVWKGAGSYTGCDLKPQSDSRLMFCADNRRVLRAIDLAQFNIFDFDAYGSPWEQAIILAARRKIKPGEQIGLLLTDGNGIGYKMNNVPHAVTMLTGIRAGGVGLGKLQDGIIDRAVAGIAKLMHCEIAKRWQAMRNDTGPAPRYIGLILRGK